MEGEAPIYSPDPLSATAEGVVLAPCSAIAGSEIGDIDSG